MSLSDEQETARALNTLAREQMIRKLLSDIAVDMQICTLEGWSIREYAERLKAEIDGIIERFES